MRGYRYPTSLDVSDSPANLVILAIAGGLPESSCDFILKGDQSGDSMRAAVAQILLPRPCQCQSDALPSLPIADRKSVHIPPPSVPSGDQGTDDLSPAVRHKQGCRGIENHAQDIIDPVWGAGVLASSLCPEFQHRRNLGPTAMTYGNSPVIQFQKDNSGTVGAIPLRSLNRPCDDSGRFKPAKLAGIGELIEFDVTVRRVLR